MKLLATGSSILAATQKFRDTLTGRKYSVHLILDALRSDFSSRSLHYWRDKSRREVDFVVERSGGEVDALEAKINPDAFSPRSLRVFREHYPEGRNLLVCPFVDSPYAIRSGGMEVTVCGTPHIAQCLAR